uniref:Uncharacterized protein n=1 Tax=Chrysotila carterae TaxID=13221 RepID=A0A7S4B776_CHRCT
MRSSKKRTHAHAKTLQVICSFALALHLLVDEFARPCCLRRWLHSSRCFRPGFTPDAAPALAFALCLLAPFSTLRAHAVTPVWRRCGSRLASQVFEVATDFEGQSYDFVCWNCHSFLASFLNRLNYGPDVCARLLHGWTVAGVAARLFVSARFVNFWGFVKTWGGNLAIWTAVLLSTLLSNSYALLEAWVWVLATTNLLFISWFLALTALGARSQWGLLRHSRDGDSAAEMRDPDAMLTQVGLSRRQRSSSSSEISVRL